MLSGRSQAGTAITTGVFSLIWVDKLLRKPRMMVLHSCFSVFSLMSIGGVDMGLPR